jgi:hypothetical protein
MTAEQLKNLLGVTEFDEEFAYYPQVQYIKLKRDHSAISGEFRRSRFRFDFEESGLMEHVICRLYSTNGAYPSHGNYDAYPTGSNNIYEYLTDSNGDMIIDYYPIDMIEVVEIREVE